MCTTTHMRHSMPAHTSVAHTRTHGTARRALFGLKELRHVDVRSGGKKETCKVPSEMASIMPNLRIHGGSAGKKKGGKKKGGKKKKKK